MPSPAPQLGAPVTAAGQAAVRIGSELLSCFEGRFSCCCRSWDTLEECEELLSGALLVTHNGDAWARAEGSAAEVDVSGCVVPYVRGMGYARAPIDESWLVNLDVIVPAALGTFATDTSPGAAFAGNAYETELIWENDTIVGVRVTIEHTIHEDTVAAYLEQRSGSLAKLLWPTLGSGMELRGWLRLGKSFHAGPGYHRGIAFSRAHGRMAPGGGVESYPACRGGWLVVGSWVNIYLTAQLVARGPCA